MKIFKSINRCRASNKKDLITVFKFPNFYLTGIFPKKNQKIYKTPFEVVFSKSSKLLQLKHNYNQKFLYGKNYGYRSGLNPVMIKHLKEKYFILKKKLDLKKKDKFLDIGSNDSTFLNFSECKKYGVDPSMEKYLSYYKKDTDTYINTFEKAFRKLKGKKFKLITSVAMFYDLPDPLSFLNKIKLILSKDGIFHVEVANVLSFIDNFSYDTFCHEHFEFYSLSSLEFLVKKSNLRIKDFGFNNINGGSIWLDIVQDNSKFRSKEKKIAKFINYEKKRGLHKVSTYKQYFQDVYKHSKKLNNLLLNLKENNKKIAGLGASTKGNVLLQFCNIGNKQIDYIYDVNSFKFGKYTPGTNIEIKDESKMNLNNYDYILILIWHFNKFIIKKIREKNKKIKIITPFPKIQIF
tara:strand:- start:4152 stop:5369 length:1218 start_codon:yes stop_codon:yes gene_type:complete